MFLNHNYSRSGTIVAVGNGPDGPVMLRDGSEYSRCRVLYAGLLAELRSLWPGQHISIHGRADMRRDDDGGWIIRNIEIWGFEPLEDISPLEIYQAGAQNSKGA